MDWLSRKTTEDCQVQPSSQIQVKQSRFLTTSKVHSLPGQSVLVLNHPLSNTTGGQNMKKGYGFRKRQGEHSSITIKSKIDRRKLIQPTANLDIKVEWKLTKPKIKTMLFLFLPCPRLNFAPSRWNTSAVRIG